MLIQFSNSFILQIHRRFVFVRLPWVGQAIFGPSVGGSGEWFVFDGWRTLKTTGEVA